MSNTLEKKSILKQQATKPSSPARTTMELVGFWRMVVQPKRARKVWSGILPSTTYTCLPI